MQKNAVFTSFAPHTPGIGTLEVGGKPRIPEQRLRIRKQDVPSFIKTGCDFPGLCGWRKCG
jgi:hypothetical protein